MCDALQNGFEMAGSRTSITRRVHNGGGEPNQLNRIFVYNTYFVEGINATVWAQCIVHEHDNGRAG